MKIKVINRFFDRKNDFILREAGQELELPEDRAEQLISLGLVIPAEENEQKQDQEKEKENFPIDVPRKSPEEPAEAEIPAEKPAKKPAARKKPKKNEEA